VDLPCGEQSRCFVIAACYAESISISRRSFKRQKSSRRRRKKIPYALYTNSASRISKSPYGSPHALSVLMQPEDLHA
jgi:hypothetical protein